MKILTGALAAMGVLGLMGTASAVEFRNLDSRNVTVKITSPTLDKVYEFRGMSRSLVICVDKCKFEVAGVGTVTASRDDIITLENGQVISTYVPVAEPAKPTKHHKAGKTGRGKTSRSR